jgi:hypothetical protein
MGIEDGMVYVATRYYKGYNISGRLRNKQSRLVRLLNLLAFINPINSIRARLNLQSSQAE